MLKNYLVIAFRTLRKHRFYSALNVLGLAIGLAVCLLIFLYVQDERSYDRHFTQADNIYRVRALFSAQQVQSEEARVAFPAADLLKNDFAEVTHAVRLIGIDQTPLFVRDERRFYEAHFFFADADFFAVFDIPFLRGDPETALRDPSSIVLTASIARKYFDDADPIGQTLLYDNRVDLTVTGVIEDLPHNTHFNFEMLASRESIVPIYSEGILQPLNNWGWPSTYTYLLLTQEADAVALEAKLPEFMDRNEAQDALSLFLQPLQDIHLRSHLELEMQPNGNITQVYTFSAIALLILLIACINFMNLATARGALRAKEVGMRKVVGARRGQIVAQFLGQSLLMTLIAMGIALVLVALTLPAFNTFLGKDLAVGYLSDPFILPGLLLLGLVVGIGAGLYPAFYLSGAKIQSVLRGATTSGKQGRLVRKGLVVTQFAISIVLIVSTGLVYAQMQYARSLPLGYEKEQMVILSGLGRLDDAQARETLRNQLLQHANILDVTSSSLVPTETLFAGTGFRLPGQADDEEGLFYRINPVDHEFFDTFGIEMVAGRAFSRDYSTDQVSAPPEQGETPEDEVPNERPPEPTRTGALILNESGAAKAGWTPEEAIDKTMILGDISFRVVGVAKDIYFSSVHHEIEPLVYFVDEQGLGTMAIKVAAADLSTTLAYIDQTWASLVPTYPITRTFLDDRFNALYLQEERTATVITYFSLFAVFIACLGLLGLAAFTAERRTKEIGVRKVLGASIGHIVFLLSKEFTLLVGIAFVVAAPIAYFAMDRWLQDFAYRVEISLWIFLGAGLIALLVAFFTVSYQSIRAALNDPVESLRYE